MAEYYMEELQSFLRQLAANNNREWFAANRERYDRLRQRWLADIDRLIAAMAEWEPAAAGHSAKDVTFRIYRDTRFSPDKTPFKTYFSSAPGPFGKHTDRAGYYLEMGVDDRCGLYGGLWCPELAMLKKIRRAIVDNIEEFESIITHPDFVGLFPEWCGQQLKTVPKGWDRNHPQAHLLRMKDYGRVSHVGNEYFLDPSWPEITAERFRALKPFVDFLNYTIDE